MYQELIKKLESVSANNYVVCEAENLADDVLKISGLYGKVAPTPIIKIATEFGFATYTTQNMPEDISGNIFVGGSTKKYYNVDKVIIVGKNEPLPHQRFIVAHELAHYLMDYIGNRDYVGKNLLFTKTYPKISHNSHEEIRADRFAAELLMPKNVFKLEYVRAMTRSDYSDEYTITYLSQLFKTKESSVKRRIQEVCE